MRSPPKVGHRNCFSPESTGAHLKPSGESMKIWNLGVALALVLSIPSVTFAGEAQSAKKRSLRSVIGEASVEMVLEAGQMYVGWQTAHSGRGVIPGALVLAMGGLDFGTNLVNVIRKV